MTTQTDRYYAEGYESGSMDLHKWMRRAEKAEARIAALEAALRNAKIAHRECEDCWYSCPLSTDGCCDEREKECNCGADKHNSAIDAILNATAPETKAEPECTEDCVRLGDQHPECPKHGRDAALLRFAAACQSKTGAKHGS